MPAYRGITVLAAAAAALAFVTAPALAGPGKKASTPAQPIPYDQLNSKTPKAKARTGVKADTSATVGDSASTTAGSDAATTAATPSPSTMDATSPNTVNPTTDPGAAPK